MRSSTVKFPISAQPFIPQRPPIVMIDNILSSDEASFETDLLVREDNVFVDGGLFRECGLMENIAQTCAAFIGFSLDDENVPIGVIGGIKDFSAVTLPSVGTTIRTRIHAIAAIDLAKVVAAEVFYNEQVIATCTMKVFIAPDSDERK